MIKYEISATDTHREKLRLLLRSLLAYDRDTFRIYAFGKYGRALNEIKQVFEKTKSHLHTLPKSHEL
uniref:Uncharacterized protein n=1 Tax=viral metagenome TaxID=1070528 RepID=A0A6C0ENQ0_9ZZZZ